MSSRAQSVSGFGAVTGIVWDNLGDRLPDADVVLLNDALNFRRSMITTLDGVFNASALVPSSSYRLEISRKGFTSVETREFQVSVGQVVTVQFTLLTRPPAAHVDVPAELPPSDGTHNPGATSITPVQIQSLPTRERRWDTLALLAPTVNVDPARHALAIRGESVFNTQLTDGITTTALFPTRQSPLATLPSQDAIQEFQVLSGDYSAEFGHAMGGVVNAVTRTGTNTFHGTAYGYGSNQSLAALNRYALGNNLYGKRGQAGGSLGGWLREHEIYFFTNAEVYDANHSALNRITSPLFTGPSGMSVLSSSCLASAALCSAATSYVQSQMNVLVPRSDHYFTGLAKLDYRMNEANTLSLIFNSRHERTPENSGLGDVAPNGGLLGSGTSRQEFRYAKAQWINSLASNTTNEFSLGLFANRIADPATDTSLSTGQLGINIGGANLGAMRSYDGIFSERRIQILDNFTTVSTSHTLSFGLAVSSNRDYANDLPNAAGTYTYSTLTDFAQDLPGGLTARHYTNFTQQLGDPIRTLRTVDTSLYAQDTWAATSRLKVTAGIRYDHIAAPQPPESNSNYYFTGSIASSPADFAPRVGVAYSPDDQTVIRVGYGLFYAPYNGELLDKLYLGSAEAQADITVNGNWTGAPVFPHSFLNINSISSGMTNLYWGTTKLRTQYAKDFTLALQRTLGSTTVEAAFHDTRGARLWSTIDYNLTPSSKVATYSIADASGQIVDAQKLSVWTARNDEDYAHLYEIGNSAMSSYRALAVAVRRRVGHGFGLQASYTYAHAISSTSGPKIAGTVPLSLANSFEGQPDKGDASTDQRHRAVINWTWQPMPMRNTSPLARYVVNGWELSSITTLASAQPATATVLLTGQQFTGSSNPTLVYPTTLNGTDGWSRLPWGRINGLRADPEYTVNARITRTLPFTERVKGLLQFEAYNLFNSQFNTGVNSVAYIATGGVLRPVAGSGAGNSSWLFPEGSNARSCQVALRVIF